MKINGKHLHMQQHETGKNRPNKVNNKRSVAIAPTFANSSRTLFPYGLKVTQAQPKEVTTKKNSTQTASMTTTAIATKTSARATTTKKNCDKNENSAGN